MHQKQRNRFGPAFIFGRRFRNLIAMPDADIPAAAIQHRRHTTLYIDPERLDARAQKAGKRIAKLETFNAEQIAECKELFDMFDKDRSGTLEKEEFAPMMRTLGLNLTQKELDMFFDRMDDSGDGLIEFSELITFLQRIARPISLEEELAEAFRFFRPSEPEFGSPALDQQGEVITARSLWEVLRNMGEEISEDECSAMIAAAAGGQQAVDFKTFKQFCRVAPLRSQHPGGG